MLKGQRKHRFSANKMDFDFNRRCDLLPGRQPEGRGVARLGHHAAGRRLRTLRQGQVRSSKAATEGGHVLIRLGNDESLGRELRTYLQTEKYLSAQERRHAVRIDQDASCGTAAEDNRERRERLTTLLGEMLAAAEYFVAGPAAQAQGDDADGGAGRGDGVPHPEHVQQDGLPQAARRRAAARKSRPSCAATTSPRRQLLFQTGENNPRGHRRPAQLLCNSVR